MKLVESLQYIRQQVSDGKKTRTSPFPEIREEGQKQIWRARRIARRLGYRNLAQLAIDL